jgi:F-type H+-transporting ATPase subunit a
MEFQQNTQSTNQHEAAASATQTGHNEGHTAKDEHETNVGNVIFHHIMNSDEIEITPIGTIHLPYMFFDKDGFHFFKNREQLTQTTTYKVDPEKFPIKAQRADGMPISLDMSITRHLIFLWLACILLFLVVKKAAKINAKSLVPKGIGNLIEVLVVYVRDEIVLQTIGEAGRKMLPFFLSIFIFILFSNFLGLLPYTSTATGNISVTAGLALIAFFMIQISGIRHNGFIGYFKGLVPHGIPTALLPIMIVVEFIGLFTKPFALCIRLFANMTAGHVIILSLLCLIFVFKSVAVSPISIAFSLFIYLLEILVALLQAYIFTILTSLFTGMAVHQEH